MSTDHVAGAERLATALDGLRDLDPSDYPEGVQAAVRDVTSRLEEATRRSRYHELVQELQADERVQACRISDVDADGNAHITIELAEDALKPAPGIDVDGTGTPVMVCVRCRGVCGQRMTPPEECPTCGSPGPFETSFKSDDIAKSLKQQRDEDDAEQRLEENASKMAVPDEADDTETGAPSEPTEDATTTEGPDGGDLDEYEDAESIDDAFGTTANPGDDEGADAEPSDNDPAVDETTDDESLPESAVVEVLKEQGELTGPEIKAASELADGTFYGVVSSLKSAGRIETRKDPRDRRRSLYRLAGTPPRDDLDEGDDEEDDPQESAEDLAEGEDLPPEQQAFVLEWGRWGPPHGGTYHESKDCRVLNRSDSDREATALPWPQNELEDDDEWSACGHCSDDSTDAEPADPAEFPDQELDDADPAVERVDTDAADDTADDETDAATETDPEQSPFADPESGHKYSTNGAFHDPDTDTDGDAATEETSPDGGATTHQVGDPIGDQPPSPFTDYDPSDSVEDEHIPLPDGVSVLDVREAVDEDGVHSLRDVADILDLPHRTVQTLRVATHKLGLYDALTKPEARSSTEADDG